MSSTSKFWYVPLKDVADADARTAIAARDKVFAADLPAHYAVPGKLFREGIRPGHILALHDGDEVAALARVLELDEKGTLHWRRLPLLTAAKPVATPELSEVKLHEQTQFSVGIDALLSDVPFAPQLSVTPEPKSYSPSGPPSNVILYGPPGTGKTYSVRARALELLGYPSASTATGEDLRTEWERLRLEGRIVFCTFHQAFAYEEFVEGLRAETDEDGGVHYRVEPGVFKRLALSAAAEGLAGDEEAEESFDDLWEALVESLRIEPRIVESSSKKKYQLEPASRGAIAAISGTVDEDGAFEPLKKPLFASENSMKLLWENRKQLGASPNTTQIGQVAKGHVTAMWMVYRELLEVQKSTHRFADPAVRAQRALSTGRSFKFPAACRQYVLVIDEINRANIARVFGELITLLEPDKRIGCSNAHIVELPGSKLPFGVPPNLHVLGTMNTADRSIALMDVALRRRFTFEEMMPDASIIDRELELAGAAQALRDLVVKVFERLNTRLRYLYDREHQIGHAYFLGVRTLGDLRQVFADRILPLLQEYFFGQWDKVALALGYPLKAEGTPKEFRDPSATVGTLLTVSRLEEKVVLGFDHDEYVDQVAWDVHPVFRPRGPAPTSDQWLAEAFLEVVGVVERSAAAAQLVAGLSGVKES